MRAYGARPQRRAPHACNVEAVEHIGDVWQRAAVVRDTRLTPPQT